MNPKLSILIPTTPDRHDYVIALQKQFEQQLGPINDSIAIDLGATSVLWRDIYGPVEIVYWQDEKKHSIGQKRNRLLDLALGEYLDFIDSDDRISDNYFKLIFEGIIKSVDCCSLKGIITEDGERPLIFEHSIKYKAYKTIVDSFYPEVTYERYPNHLNCIKSSIAKQFKFPETNHGEDTDWATQIFKSGLLKTEHYIEEVLYFYDYRSNK